MRSLYNGIVLSEDWPPLAFQGARFTQFIATAPICIAQSRWLVLQSDAAYDRCVGTISIS